MSRLVIKRPRVQFDLIDQMERIARQSPQAADRFADAVNRTLDQLARMPGIGHLSEFGPKRLRDIRVSAVRGFKNHLIFYRPVAEGIEVVRILHGSRDIGEIMESEDS